MKYQVTSDFFLLETAVCSYQLIDVMDKLITVYIQLQFTKIHIKEKKSRKEKERKATSDTASDTQ